MGYSAFMKKLTETALKHDLTVHVGESGHVRSITFQGSKRQTRDFLLEVERSTKDGQEERIKELEDGLKECRYLADDTDNEKIRDLVNGILGEEEEDDE